MVYLSQREQRKDVAESKAQPEGLDTSFVTAEVKEGFPQDVEKGMLCAVG